MKVDSRALNAYQSSLNLRVQNSNGSPSSKGASVVTSNAPSEDARVTISSAARQLAAGSAATSTTSTDSDSSVDVAKVAALKDKIQNGTLTFDSSTIAARIVDRTG